ncbi:MAG: protein kinase [Leptolyngbya sp. BL-A-14]
MSNVLTPVETSYPGLDRLLDGRYQVIQVLESGHWGHTYLAQDTRRPSQAECMIQHVIPVKRDPMYQSALRQLFVREAATLERLGAHEQIPQLLACFENEQGFHLVQETVSGTALSLELESQPWREDRVVQLLLECLEVLAVVHQDCYRHGDIRPDNLIRRSHDGALILTNFGSARDLHLSLMTLQRQPATSRVPNTQGYQPEEQVQGLPCLASDIYAVGMIGIQALTGMTPLQMSRDALTGEVCWQPFGQTPGSTLRHGLVAVLSRMVRADQTQRYPSAKEALQAVRQLAQVGLLAAINQPPIASAIEPPSQTQEPSSSLPAKVPESETMVERLFSPAVQIGVGIGAVMAAAVCGYALPHLLDHALFGDNDQDGQARADATPRQPAGQTPKAIAAVEAFPKENAFTALNRSLTVTRSNNAPTINLSASNLKTASPQGNQLTQATGTPQTDGQPSATTVAPSPASPAETAAELALKKAYDQAIDKDFARAIEALSQIPANTAVYPKAQEKLREYSDKQQIQAVSYLQTAYNQAETKAFDKALGTLQKISEATTAYPTAQEKIREYTEKQRIRAEVLAMNDLNPSSYLQETNVQVATRVGGR